MKIDKNHSRGYYNIEANDDRQKVEEGDEQYSKRGRNRLLDDVYQGISRNKLNVYDWLGSVHDLNDGFNLVEVRFKNTRKAIFENDSNLSLKQGDIVAVEASPGHDIGVVSLTGDLVKKQIQRRRDKDIVYKKIYRKAKSLDIEKWKAARQLEYPTMLKARVLARELDLAMKIGDVEYQGDKTKAIFYYIADERVDFRQLIKKMAEEFKIRIEMRQIGARQEAGGIGGIGPCGKALCCSKWMSTFSSVSTNSARLQELSLNPQKLAGQCGKLKCCLNFECGVYKDAKKQFPDTRTILETEDGLAYYQKSDVLQGVLWYSFDQHSSINLTPIKIDRVKEIISLNKKGVKVDSLSGEEAKDYANDFSQIVGQDSLTRFDKPKKSKKRPSRKRKGNPNKTAGEQGRNQADNNRRQDNRSNKGKQQAKNNNQKKNKASQSEKNEQNKSANKGNNKFNRNKPNQSASNKPNPKQKTDK